MKDCRNTQTSIWTIMASFSQSGWWSVWQKYSFLQLEPIVPVLCQIWFEMVHSQYCESHDRIPSIYHTLPFRHVWFPNENDSPFQKTNTDVTIEELLKSSRKSVGKWIPVWRWNNLRESGPSRQAGRKLKRKGGRKSQYNV